MPLAPEAVQSHFQAKTHRVVSPDRIEAQIELPFGVILNKLVQIHGFGFQPGQFSDTEFDRARHCLVVLVGGRRLIVSPCDPVGDWFRRSPLVARVFLDQKVKNQPIGYTSNLAFSTESVVEAGPYMEWLRTKQFPIDHVNRTLYGDKGKKATTVS